MYGGGQESVVVLMSYLACKCRPVVVSLACAWLKKGLVVQYMWQLSRDLEAQLQVSDNGGWSGYGSQSIRTTPQSSPLWAFLFSSLSIFAPVNISSGPREPTEYTGEVSLIAAGVVLVISVVMPALTPPLLGPKPVDQWVLTPDERVVRVRNLSADQRWPWSSSFASRKLPEMQRIEAPATTGMLATVSDMQSSTSPEMSSGKPPSSMYGACTRDTIVVTTAAWVSA